MEMSRGRSTADRSSKGVFVTISMMFLVLALLLIISMLSSLESGKKQVYAEVNELAQISSIRSNIEWMTKEAFSVSGFRFMVYNQTISIEENASKRGSLSKDLTAIQEFWTNTTKINATLDFHENAFIPEVYIRPVNITLIQSATNTSILVPASSDSSVKAYYLTIRTGCSALTKKWNDLTESSAPDAINLTIDVECTDSGDSVSDFRSLERHAYHELQITDGESNLTVVRLSNSSMEIMKHRSSYLNIIMPMNENVYCEVPSMMNISAGDASYSGAIRLPGDLG